MDRERKEQRTFKTTDTDTHVTSFPDDRLYATQNMYEKSTEKGVLQPIPGVTAAAANLATSTHIRALGIYVPATAPPLVEYTVIICNMSSGVDKCRVFTTSSKGATNTVYEMDSGAFTATGSDYEIVSYSISTTYASAFIANGVDPIKVLEGGDPFVLANAAGSNAPPRGKHIIVYNNRLFVANYPADATYTTADGNKAWYSNILTTNFASTNYIQVGDSGDGDEITGFGVLASGAGETVSTSLLIFKKYSIWILNGDPIGSDTILDRLQAPTGTDMAKTIKSTEVGVIYTGTDGHVYLVSPEGRVTDISIGVSSITTTIDHTYGNAVVHDGFYKLFLGQTGGEMWFNFSNPQNYIWTGSHARGGFESSLRGRDGTLFLAGTSRAWYEDSTSFVDRSGNTLLRVIGGAFTEPWGVEKVPDLLGIKLRTNATTLTTTLKSGDSADGPYTGTGGYSSTVIGTVPFSQRKIFTFEQANVPEFVYWDLASHRGKEIVWQLSMLPTAIVKFYGVEIEYLIPKQAKETVRNVPT